MGSPVQQTNPQHRSPISSPSHCTLAGRPYTQTSRSQRANPQCAVPHCRLHHSCCHQLQFRLSVFCSTMISLATPLAWRMLAVLVHRVCQESMDASPPFTTYLLLPLAHLSSSDNPVVSLDFKDPWVITGERDGSECVTIDPGRGSPSSSSPARLSAYFLRWPASKPNVLP